MNTLTSFKDLTLPAALHGALEKMNFITPTPVQAASLPSALAGKDVLGSAQTGTGKTAAFGIPLLAKLYPNPGSRAVILAPTRELAAQIHKVLKEMSHGMELRGALLVGGESFHRQKMEVKEGADYYVCTPGRLIDHLDAGLRLDKVNMLVLDEVDRMLDMGFAPQLRQIVPHIPKERQTLFFSATLPKEILAVAATYLQDPVRVSIGATSQPIDRVKQENHVTTHLKKNDLLLEHLKVLKGRVLIFARTQHRTDRVFQLLERNKYSVVSLHGGRTQGQRKLALQNFRRGTHLIMVATDIAGRGIDVDDIECVINYDLPASREDYIHRIGRTARNGKEGTAFNYLVPNDHGGKGIIAAPQAKGAHPQHAKGAHPQHAHKPNNPGAPKGGWDSKGGRNRPTYHQRQPDQGYGGPKRKPTFGGAGSHMKAPRTFPPTGDESKAFEPRPEGPKRPFGPKPFGPKRPFGEKRPFGAKPFGEKRPFGAKPFGEKRPFGAKPFGEKRPFGAKPFGEKRPFGAKPFGPKRQMPPFGKPNPSKPQEMSAADFRAPGDRRPVGEQHRPKKPFQRRRPGGKPHVSAERSPEGWRPKAF